MPSIDQQIKDALFERRFLAHGLRSDSETTRRRAEVGVARLDAEIARLRAIEHAESEHASAAIQQTYRGKK